MNAGCPFRLFQKLGFICVSAGWLIHADALADDYKWNLDANTSKEDMQAIFRPLLRGNFNLGLPQTEDAGVAAGVSTKFTTIPSSSKEKISGAFLGEPSVPGYLLYKSLVFQFGDVKSGVFNISGGMHPLTGQLLWGFGLFQKPKEDLPIMYRFSYTSLRQSSEFCAPGIGFEAVSTFPDAIMEPIIGIGGFATKGDYQKIEGDDVIRKKYTFSDGYALLGFRFSFLNLIHTYADVRFFKDQPVIGMGIFTTYDIRSKGKK